MSHVKQEADVHHTLPEESHSWLWKISKENLTLQLGQSHKQKNLDLWNPKISFLCQNRILDQTYTSGKNKVEILYRIQNEL